ncbi:PH domain-containing protein [Salarchaeum sp. JOR-1]|uniref:PH domain-containing protein n=1 Tax=Salarchaeum sp. JOR-1 TaxID=2599399 RepID=UPI001198B419|nr:PH domain-containing protein [Salarchaeum sp. JOR-1]QDX41233.1 PH domain-containing protein [Salarchaeum sp. JOR-1]
MSTHSESEWFGSDAVAAVYRVQFLLLILFVGAIPIVGTALAAPWYVSVAIAAVALAVLGLVWWWAGAYERTVGYRFGDDEFEARGGVFFRSKSTVPYARITNVETKQGPVLRYFGVGSVAVQTAGRSGQTTAEVTVSAITDYEDVRDRLVERVRAERSAGDATGNEPRPSGGDATLDDVLAELERIRGVLDDRDGE